jgi:Site-specific recombinase XerD
MLKFETAIRENQYYCQSVGMSPKTMKSYRNTPRLFFKWVEENHSINSVDEISKYHIQEYFKYKLECGLTRTYIVGIHKVLKSFFEFLLEEELIDINPILKVKMMQQETRVIETFTDKQAQNLVNYYKHDDYLNSRNRTIIAIQLDTGIRCTETLKITDADVQLDLDRIYINNSKGNKSRYVYLSQMIKKEIRKHQKVKDLYFKDKDIPENYFLSRTGRPLTVEGIERIYKRAGDELKIEGVRVSPHTSRHYFAQKALDRNDIYIVSRLLGHNNVSITQRYLASLNTSKIIERNNFISPLTK